VALDKRSRKKARVSETRGVEERKQQIRSDLSRVHVHSVDSFRSSGDGVVQGVISGCEKEIAKRSQLDARSRKEVAINSPDVMTSIESALVRLRCFMSS
jgi:hypothetical protein